jgi:hypothetical protein
MRIGLNNVWRGGCMHEDWMNVGLHIGPKKVCAMPCHASLCGVWPVTVDAEELVGVVLQLRASWPRSNTVTLSAWHYLTPSTAAILV